MMFRQAINFVRTRFKSLMTHMEGPIQTASNILEQREIIAYAKKNLFQACTPYEIHGMLKIKRKTTRPARTTSHTHIQFFICHYSMKKTIFTKWSLAISCSGALSYCEL